MPVLPDGAPPPDGPVAGSVCAGSLARFTSISSVPVGDRQLFGREERDHLAAGVRHDHFLLDARCRVPVRGRAVGLEREDHAGLDLHRALQGDEARDDRTLVESETDAVAELEAERRQLVGEAELLRLRPDLDHGVGRDAGLDQVDRQIKPLAAALVGVVLGRRRPSDIEGAVVAGAVADEGVEDVEEGLVARADEAVGEVVRMRVAALAGDGVDRLDVVGAEFVEELIDAGDDVVFPDARLQILVDQLVDAIDHGCGLVEEHDLIDAFDLARVEHDLLAVDQLQADLLEFEPHPGLDDVDADRHVVIFHGAAYVRGPSILWNKCRRNQFVHRAFHSRHVLKVINCRIDHLVNTSALGAAYATGHDQAHEIWGRRAAAPLHRRRHRHRATPARTASLPTNASWSPGSARPAVLRAACWPSWKPRVTSLTR